MDALDIKILREILKSESIGPFPSSLASLRKVGLAVGVDKDTVRNRLLALKKKGVLTGWHSMMNPNLLGMKSTRLWLGYSTEELKEKGVKALASVANVRAVYDYVGNFASTVIVHKPLSQSQKTEAEKVASKTSAQVLYKATISFPSTHTILTSSDWRIYNAIRSNPQTTHRIVANETELSPRTVKRRLQRLSEENAILVVPDIDSKKLDGIVAEILVGFDSSDFSYPLKQISSFGKNCVIREERYDAPLALFSIVSSNIATAREMYQSAKSQPGVFDTQLFILQDIVRPRSPLQFAAGSTIMNRSKT